MPQQKQGVSYLHFNSFKKGHGLTESGIIQILKDSSHPGHKLLELLPSGRPTAINALNAAKL